MKEKNIKQEEYINTLYTVFSNLRNLVDPWE